MEDYEMNEVIKGVIIFDTNFITENENNLKEIVEKLSKKYDVFITKISLEEKISQKYLELRKYYEKVNSLREKIDIEIKKELDEQYELDKIRITQYYLQQFGERIIPFYPSEDTLQIVLNRLYKKLPPFIDEEKASDKGLKDTLIWLSILNHFKNNREKNKQFFICCRCT